MSLIPSESENFPDSFRSKVGWHITEQPDDPKAAAALERLVEVASPAAPVSPPPPTQEDSAPEPDAPAEEEQLELSPQPVAAVEDNNGNQSPPTAVVAEERKEAPPEPAPPVSEVEMPPAEVLTAEPEVEVLPQPDAAPPEQPLDISPPAQPVAPEPLSPPATTPTAAPIPETDSPQAQPQPPSQDMPFRLMPNPVVEQNDPTNQGSQSQDMHALLSHIISAGVPISIGQPNGEPPQPAPIVSEPASFATSAGDLPVVEPVAQFVSPNDNEMPGPMVVDSPPVVAATDPVTPEPVASTQESDLGPLPVPDSIGDVPVIEPTKPLVQPYDFWTPVSANVEVPPVVAASNPVTPEPARSTEGTAEADEVVLAPKHEEIPAVIEPTKPLVQPYDFWTPVSANVDVPPAVAANDPMAPEPARSTAGTTAANEVVPAPKHEEMPAINEAVTAPTQETLRLREKPPVPIPQGAALTDVVRSPEHAIAALADVVPAATQEIAPPAQGSSVTRAATPTPAPAPAPKPAPTSISVATPVEARQILGLIAATMERGELAGETKNSNGAAPRPQSTPPAIPEAAVRTVGPSTGSGSIQRSEESPPGSVPPDEESASAAKRAPAKIRITPRRIKPRPQTEATGIPELTAEEIDHSPNNGSATEIESPRVDVEASEATVPVSKPPSPAAKPVPLEAKLPTPTPRPAAPPPKPTQTLINPASPAPQPVQPPQPIERGELSPARPAAATRREIQSDLLIFSARERRKRWIGFGVGEFVAVAALIVLGHYGFTHHFPDPTLKVLVFILLFAAAATAVALPIAFLRNDPARCWGREY